MRGGRRCGGDGCFSTNDVSVVDGATLAYVAALTPDEKGFVDAINCRKFR